MKYKTTMYTRIKDITLYRTGIKVKLCRKPPRRMGIRYSIKWHHKYTPVYRYLGQPKTWSLNDPVPDDIQYNYKQITRE